MTVLWKHIMKEHTDEKRKPCQISEDDVVMSGVVEQGIDMYLRMEKFQSSRMMMMDKLENMMD